MNRVRSIAVVVAVMAAAGCASATGSPLPTGAQPLGTTTTSSGAATTTVPAPQCDATASVRPPASMPTPGHMPAGSFMEKIQQRAHMVAGVSADTYKFGSVNPTTRQIEGFDIDVLSQVAKAIFGEDGHLQTIPITIPQVAGTIQSGDVDIVAHTMTITCARRAQIDFSSVYLDAHQRLLVAKSSPATSLSDLGGKKVCAAAGTTSIKQIADIAARQNVAAARPIPFPAASETDCLVAFQTGQVDAISTDDMILAGMAAQDPYSKVVGSSLNDEPYGLAISKQHQEFTSFVNGVLDRMRADGTWTALYNKWVSPFFADQQTPAPPTPNYLP